MTTSTSGLLESRQNEVIMREICCKSVSRDLLVELSDWWWSREPIDHSESCCRHLSSRGLYTCLGPTFRATCLQGIHNTTLDDVAISFRLDDPSRRSILIDCP